MEKHKRPKSIKLRKRKRTEGDEDYDFEAEVKKRKTTTKTSSKSQGNLRHLKALLKRSNFLANSLLTVITEQRKRHERQLRKILNKRKKKIEKVETKIKKNYGKQCKSVPEAYTSFLELEENQVKFADAICFRVVVIVSHLVKKVNHAEKSTSQPMSPPLSEQTTNDTLHAFRERIDEILGPDNESNSHENSNGPELASGVNTGSNEKKLTENSVKSDIQIEPSCKTEVASVINHILEAVSYNIGEYKFNSVSYTIEKDSAHNAIASARNSLSEVASVIDHLLETVSGNIEDCTSDSAENSATMSLTSSMNANTSSNFATQCIGDMRNKDNLASETNSVVNQVFQSSPNNVSDEVQTKVTLVGNLHTVAAEHSTGHYKDCVNTIDPACHVDETPNVSKGNFSRSHWMGKCRRHINMELTSTIPPAALEESKYATNHILEKVYHEIDVIETKTIHEVCAALLRDIGSLLQGASKTNSESVELERQQKSMAFIHSTCSEIEVNKVLKDSTHAGINVCLSHKEMKENCAAINASGNVDSQTSQASLSGVKVPCPICCKMVSENSINAHLDLCLTGGERRESLRTKSTARVLSKKQCILAKRATKTCTLDSLAELNQIDSKKLKLEKVEKVNSYTQDAKSEKLDQNIFDMNDKEALIGLTEGSSTSDKKATLFENVDVKAPPDDEAKKSQIRPTWKVMNPAPLAKNHLKKETPVLDEVIGFDEEEEEDIAESSSSESETDEVLIPPTELRRSLRSSRCRKSFKECSDEEEEYFEDNHEQDDKKEKEERKQSKMKVKEKTDIEESAARLTKLKYSVGDIVKIAWGQGEEGKLYQAKILDRCPTDDHDWSYLVHYIGWTDTYDDWIFTNDVHSVVKSNEEDVLVPPSVLQSYAGEELTFDEKALLDAKFYMPGMNGKVAPKSLLNEVNGIRHFKGITVSPAQPKLFTGGALRDYQIIGYEWLKILLENGENGILADEMGLGKTIQCIAIVCKMVEVGYHGPFLICAPMSTIQNWFLEFRRFAPKIPLLLYHGTAFERETLSLCMLQREHKLKTRPVVITTYDVLMRDRILLQAHHWSYMILDEGHRIKNLKCKLLMELGHIQSQGKLLLTGTPLQNNLSELWSLLNFLLPEVFDDLDTFETWFDMDRLKKDQNLLSMVHKILTPFLLRRMKCDVDLKLPPKKELIVQAPLSSRQERFYKALVNRSIKELLQQKEHYKSTVGVADPSLIAGKQNIPEMVSAAVSSEDPTKRFFRAKQEMIPIEAPRGVFVRHFSMSNTIMQLRKCCNHPYLIERPCDDKSSDTMISEDLVLSSGKLMILDKLLPKLKERGHKVLLFSQMTKMLDVLEDYCYLRSFRNVRIDGQMKRDARVESIASFTSDPDVFIFLLSTRAGGLGINLTAADTVVIYDSDWNPQNDAQAQDRCHRIGQEKLVVVYRLVTTGTVDQQIVERASKKMALEKIIMHKALFKGNLERELTDKNKIKPEELLSLLEASKESCVEDDVADDVISESELEKLLDRSGMIKSLNVSSP